jgi:hypothetical protein
MALSLETVAIETICRAWQADGTSARIASRICPEPPPTGVRPPAVAQTPSLPGPPEFPQDATP